MLNYDVNWVVIICSTKNPEVNEFCMFLTQSSSSDQSSQFMIFYRKIKREGSHCRSSFGRSGLPVASRVISFVVDLAVYEAKETSKR